MRSDVVATKLIHVDWEHVKGKDASADVFYGRVMLGEVEFKRFKITRADYVADECAPCESTAKKLRNEIAKGIREEYGE